MFLYNTCIISKAIGFWRSFYEYSGHSFRLVGIIQNVLGVLFFQRKGKLFFWRVYVFSGNQLQQIFKSYWCFRWFYHLSKGLDETSDCFFFWIAPLPLINLIYGYHPTGLFNFPCFPKLFPVACLLNSLQ